MSETESNAGESLREHFLGWQCRIRQIAMRRDGGRPSAGMRPRVTTPEGEELAPGLTVLILPEDLEETTTFFRFQVQKSNDPRLVYERGLQYLQADFFQQPATFRDTMTATVPQGAAENILAAGRVTLIFDQFRQRYDIPCAVRELPAGDPAREATLWHNRLFNPGIPDYVHVLAFQPDWDAASARAGD